MEFKPIVDEIMKDIESENQRLQQCCWQYLYEGKEIKFQFGNMANSAKGIILGSRVFHSRITVNIKNIKTGKERWIDYSHVDF